jgi:hypothetical protein
LRPHYLEQQRSRIIEIKRGCPTASFICEVKEDGMNVYTLERRLAKIEKDRSVKLIFSKQT